MDIDEKGKRLVWNGVFLFLLGLLTGFAIPNLTNPRLGVAAHMGGLMIGTFLVGIGLIWGQVKLKPSVQTFLFWLLLYGGYVHWGSGLLASIFGTSKMTPIGGAGSPPVASWKEMVVNFGLVSHALALVVCCMMILWGLRKGREA